MKKKKKREKKETGSEFILHCEHSSKSVWPWVQLLLLKQRIFVRSRSHMWNTFTHLFDLSAPWISDHVNYSGVKESKGKMIVYWFLLRGAYGKNKGRRTRTQEQVFMHHYCVQMQWETWKTNVLRSDKKTISLELKVWLIIKSYLPLQLR